MKSNVDGQKNTGIGAFSLQKTKGSNNAAVGAQSLFNNTTGFQNTAISGTLPAGNYYYSLWVDGQKTETRKMIIAR